MLLKANLFVYKQGSFADSLVKHLTGNERDVRSCLMDSLSSFCSICISALENKLFPYLHLIIHVDALKSK